MFTGVIEDIGTITSIRKIKNLYQIYIHGKKINSDLNLGSKVLINGIHFTITNISKNGFEGEKIIDPSIEPNMNLFNLGLEVNLESSIKYGNKIDGHIVTGNIDQKRIILNKKYSDNLVIFEIERKMADKKYLFPNSTLAIDGISMKIDEIQKNSFKVSLKSKQFQSTALHNKKIGDFVNLEFDLLLKYLDKHLEYADLNEKSNHSSFSKSKGLLDII